MFERLKRSFSFLIEKVTTETLSEEKLDSILWDFKVALMESDVALAVVDKICEDLKKNLAGLKVGRLEDRKKIVKEALVKSLIDVLTHEGEVDLLKLAEEKRKQRIPLSIVFVGINGTGKTTTVAKVSRLFMDKGYSVVLACSDTYRAGAIEQLEEHAKRLGVKMIKHQYGSDAASVAFDGVAYAKARGINVVLIDTAGRIETNRNLLEEMRKIVKVVNPDLVIFVGDALAGNDAATQAEEFSKFVPISASILTKMDADAKGGAALSVAYVTKKPIILIGVGQTYTDLVPFKPAEFAETLVGKL
ncbi:MAG: signal recognition particle-docking protein FtsY [Candidatus Bathyarchaeia archaeon]